MALPQINPGNHRDVSAITPASKHGVPASGRVVVPQHRQAAISLACFVNKCFPRHCLSFEAAFKLGQITFRPHCRALKNRFAAFTPPDIQISRSVARYCASVTGIKGLSKSLLYPRFCLTGRGFRCDRRSPPHMPALVPHTQHAHRSPLTATHCRAAMFALPPPVILPCMPLKRTILAGVVRYVTCFCGGGGATL